MTQDEACGLLDVSADEARVALKRAYLRKVKEHPPERDPEGFRRVREAYELLLAFPASPWVGGPPDEPADSIAQPADVAEARPSARAGDASEDPDRPGSSAAEAPPAEEWPAETPAGRLEEADAGAGATPAEDSPGDTPTEGTLEALFEEAARAAEEGWEEELQVWRRAFRRFPRSEPILEMLHDTLCKHGRRKRARKLLQDSVDQLERAAILLAESHSDWVDDEVLEELADRDDPDARSAAALAWARRGSPGAATRAFVAAFEGTEPLSPIVVRRCVRALARLFAGGRAAAARRLLRALYAALRERGQERSLHGELAVELALLDQLDSVADDLAPAAVAYFGARIAPEEPIPQGLRVSRLPESKGQRARRTLNERAPDLLRLVESAQVADAGEVVARARGRIVWQLLVIALIMVVGMVLKKPSRAPESRRPREPLEIVTIGGAKLTPAGGASGDAGRESPPRDGGPSPPPAAAAVPTGPPVGPRAGAWRSSPGPRGVGSAGVQP